MITKLLVLADPARLRSLVAAAALTGVLAGLAAATFASVAGEPLIGDAIAIEEADAAAHPEPAASGHDEEASVSRRDQRGAGLFGAYALTGAAFGVLLALTAYGLRRGRPDAGRRLLVAGAVLAGAFTVAPWLKYPPNPPAVGDPATLGQRQSLYVAVICIAAAVGLAGTWLSGRLRAAGWPDERRWATVALAVAVPMAAAFVVLPGAPDPVLVPATLVWRFRLASLGASLILWTVLTLGMGWVVATAARRAAPPAGPGRRSARMPA